MATAKRRPKDDSFRGFTQMLQVAMMPRAQQMTTVLGLLRRNVDELTADQQLVLLRGLQAVHPSKARNNEHGGEVRWKFTVPPEALPTNKLRTILKTLDVSIRQFLTDGRWSLPAPSSLWLERDDGSLWWTFEPASNTDAIVVGIADLVWQHADRIKACERCDALFLKKKRQQFCTRQCAQLARDTRKVQRKGGR